MTLFERLFPGNLVVWYTESMKTCFCMTYRRERNGRNGRTGISAFAAAMLRFCSCLIAALILASAAAGEKGTWEDRLAQARIRYNEETVNIFVRGRGRKQAGKVNICFYYSWRDRCYAINIGESLQITDEAEMEAILELIAQNEIYSPEEFGSISFMKAEWVAHNIAHSMATGDENQKQMVEKIVGKSIPAIVGSSKELDLSPYREITEQQRTLYELIEFFLQLGGK